MLTKFETKSNRVKGLSFHPKRPWILASLHSGVIQLWDYKMGALLDRFDEHDGPVRGIDFHRSQPLFVSGGDDYKIKVWNYKMRRCLFTLLGHVDYIRTVQFHPEYPWIVSASDDQTICIWNWQSRSRISVLTGHNHYVMCASFRESEDLVVSASLDQTVRLWDISGLRKKTVAPADEMLRLPQMNSDIFGGGDANVKHVMEGHDRGVNWASFHPTLPLIVSGADDRQVKLWRWNDAKGWELDALRGHSNNVSCVLFLAKQDIMVSNSEDKSIRVWDMSKKTGVQTFRREHDRFWILANHPDQNLLAAGHDSGLIVFKLERERPAFVVNQQTLYYVRDRTLRSMDFTTGQENQIIPIRRAGTVGSNQAPRTLSYNPAENAILIHSDIEGGSYELFMLPADSKSSSSQEPFGAEGRRGLGASAVFVARNRFAVLDKGAGQILIKNLSNEVTKKCPPPCASTDALFYAGTGSVLCRAEDRVVLFDIQQRAAMAELSSPLVKYVVWRSDMEYVALISKHVIIVANKKLKHVCTVHETVRIKGGAWDDNGVFIYTTLNHIKYCLPNGDTGIIRTLETPVYITKVFGNILYCLDREGKNRQIQIDPSEYSFKLALLHKKYDQVVAMIRNSQLCGQSIIAYLQQKGFPEIALHFVGDDLTRFNLAIDCGNIDAALESAKSLDSKEVWHRLGVEALRQGSLEIVEFAYQKTKNFERLSFLYLITGNVEKLTKTLKISEMQNDVMGQFHNSLYLGDVPGRIKILEESGHLPLAYVAARQHGFDEDAERIAESLNLAENSQLAQDLTETVESTKGSLLMPAQPVLRQGNWPLLTISRGIFDSLFIDGADIGADEMYGDDMDGDAGWGGDDIDFAGGGDEDAFGDVDGEIGGDDDDGWEMEDLDLPPDALASVETTFSATGGAYIPPTPGIPLAQRWGEKSSLAGECAAVGAFDTAMRLLNRQIGAADFEPLKPYMLELYMASHAYVPGVPSATAPPILAPLGRESGGPALAYKLSHLEEALRRAFQQFTGGKFSEAHKTFKDILLKSFLVVVESRKEVDDVKERQLTAREYCNWLMIEQARKEVAEKDPKRNQELSAYMTHCDLQPFHIQKTLFKTLATTIKCNNYATTSSFCRRLLEYNPSPPVVQKTRQALAACEKAGLKDSTQLEYDSRNPFVLCSKSFTPIYRGNKFLRCNCCGSYYKTQFKGNICVVCKVGRIGLDSSGLVCSPSQVRG